MKCELCDEETPNGFNIKFKRIPICESCANSITLQQMNFLMRCNSKPIPPKDRIIPQGI